jgi:hypothetical protein
MVVVYNKATSQARSRHKIVTDEILRVASSSDYRSYPNQVVRAAHMVKNGIGSPHHVSMALRVSRCAVLRAVKALQEGRTPCVEGAPHALPEEGRKKLKQWITEKNNANQFPTSEAIAEKVVPT